MNHRLHIHKKAFSQSASTSASNLFQSRPFVVPETATPTPQETPDFQQQQEWKQPKGINLLGIPNIVAGSSPLPEPPQALQLQAKLTIGEPGDRYEQEADRVAADVVQRIHAPSPQVQREEIESVGDEQMHMSPFVQQSRKAVVQRQEQESVEDEQIRMSPIESHWRNALVQRQDVLDEEQVMMKPQVSILQRQEVQELNLKSNLRNPKSEGMAAAPDLEASIQGARGSGQPLDESVLGLMEREFGADFSGVRVHTDGTSDQLNQSIQAKAFTTGQDVFFRSGAYDPRSRGGQELIAHELTHVVQQSGGAVQRSQLQATEQTPQASTSLKRDESNTVQRKILLKSPHYEFNVEGLLAIIGITNESILRDWFKTRIRPKLMGKFGYEKFKGYLKHDSPEYTFEAGINTANATPSYHEVTTGVIKAINIHLMSKIVDKGHSSIGNVKLLKRQGFPSYIKQAFDKNPVMKETGLKSKEIHLRHFVMGSWFRALPDLVQKAQLTQLEDNDLTKRVGNLIPVLGPFSGIKNAQASDNLNINMQVLAKILHDFGPNLNAGEGPENSLIGFLSHAYSELAQQVLKDKTSIEKNDLPEFVNGTIDALNLISQDARQEWIKNVEAIDAFMALVNNVSPDADALPPDILAQVMHDFAYQLGMDFMKRQSGMMSDISEVTTIAQLQQMLAPIGENLYALIVSAQDNDVDYAELSKLLNKIEVMAEWLGTLS